MNLKNIVSFPFGYIEKYFNKYNLPNFEVKVTNPSSPMGLSIMPTGDKPILYAPEAILFYQECAPIQTAINKITDELASIKPLIYDMDKQEYSDDLNKFPILKLLQYPDADMVWSEFIQAIGNFYLITGNAFIKADGYINRPPLSLRIMPSQGVSIMVGFDGWPQTIIARIMSLMDTFIRTNVIEDDQERFRYYANEFKELYQIRTFNPLLNTSMGFGLSPLNAIWYDMRQYVDSAKYNLSVLQRSSRLSGYFKSTGILNDKIKTTIQEQVDQTMVGSNNAGRTPVLNADMEFVDLMKNMRDMDYVQMRNQVTMSIYNALKIPLPLINPEHSTMSNMETSRILLYDNAVIPLAKKIFQELTNFLMPRYKNSDHLILTFNEKDIPALEPRRNEQSKLKKDMGIFTPNELRKDYGFESLENGNIIYGTISNVPLMTDNTDIEAIVQQSTEDEKPINPNNSSKPNSQEKPQQQENEESDQDIGKPQDDQTMEEQEISEERDKNKKASRDKFISTLRMQVTKEGVSQFTEDEINLLAEKHYGK